MSLAWHVEAFARSKKLPKLADLMKPARKKREKPQSWQEQLSIAQAWAAKFSTNP